MKIKQENYKKLVKFLKGYINETITRDNLEEEMYKFLGIIEARGINNTIKRLHYDNVLKVVEGTKARDYEIQRPNESGE